MRSRRDASACSSRSSGSHGAMSGSASDSQNATSRRQRPNVSTSAGSNQPPLRFLAMPQAARTPPAAWKISSVCARQTMRASSGISSPRRPLRLAAAVPVLVERADRLRGLGAEADQQRDLGAAVAARLHQPARHLALVLDRLQPPAAVAQPAVGGDRAQRPHERRQLAGPVDALGRALGELVVGAEQRRHASGVRGAAGVLEEQRVEEVGAGPGVEAELLRQPHADHARAERVAGRLPLREIECVGERADDLRQPDRAAFRGHRGGRYRGLAIV